MLLLALAACKKDDVATTGITPVPEVYQKIYGATVLYVEGEYVVIKTKDLPDHKSPYTGTNYEAYNGPNTAWQQNPNRIIEQNYTFRLPLHPAEVSRKAATPLGAIGVSLNGVPFFNQYAAGGAPLTNEVNGFDQYNGHPQNTGVYHYHVGPLALTASKGRSALLGFLLDDFPVYGPLKTAAPWPPPTLTPTTATPWLPPTTLAAAITTTSPAPTPTSMAAAFLARRARFRSSVQAGLLLSGVLGSCAGPSQPPQLPAGAAYLQLRGAVLY